MGRWRRIASEIIAFVAFRPEHLHNQADADAETGAFPCPRTWEYVSDLLAVETPDAVLHDMLAGLVGTGVAAEFVGFLATARTLPNVDRIIEDPKGTHVPTEPDAQFAVSAALSRRMDSETYGAIATYLERMPGEFGALATTLAIERDASIQHCSAFVDWCVVNAVSKAA